MEAMDGIILHDFELRIGWGKAIHLPAMPIWAGPNAAGSGALADAASGFSAPGGGGGGGGGAAVPPPPVLGGFGMGAAAAAAAAAGGGAAVPWGGAAGGVRHDTSRSMHEVRRRGAAGATAQPCQGPRVKIDFGSSALALCYRAMDACDKARHHAGTKRGDGARACACRVLAQGVGQDIDVPIVEDLKQRFIIDSLAMYVLRDGCPFEQVRWAGAGRTRGAPAGGGGGGGGDGSRVGVSDEGRCVVSRLRSGRRRRASVVFSGGKAEGAQGVRHGRGARAGAGGQLADWCVLPLLLPALLPPPQIIMEEMQGDPEYAFLFKLDSPEHIYYRRAPVYRSFRARASHARAAGRGGSYRLHPHPPWDVGDEEAFALFVSRKRGRVVVAAVRACCSGNAGGACTPWPRATRCARGASTRL